MKAIILARVSTEEQREAGNSLPAQVVRMENYCKRKNFDIIEVFSFDESAYKEKRDEFDRILDYLKNNKEKIAVCFDKVDRLSRNVFDKRVSELYEKAVAGSIELHFVSDGQVINSSLSATEKFQFSISLGLAKYYSDAISDNVKRAFEQKRRNGEWTGSVRSGYKNITLENGKKDIIPDSERSHLVIKIFELYSTGNHSLTSIHDEMDRLGLRSPEGKPLSRSNVDNILQDSFYYGIAKSKKHGPYPHRYERLISVDLFEKCQNVRLSRKKAPFKVISNDFILKGLLTCKNCGCLYTPEIKKGRFIYYSCTNAKRTCKRVYVPEKTLLKPVYEVLNAFESITQAVQERLVDELRKTNESEVEFHQKEIARIRTEHDRSQTKVDRLLDALLDQSITKDQHDKKLYELKDLQYRLNTEMEEHIKADHEYHINVATVLNLSRRARIIFESSEPAEKRAFLNMLLQNPVVEEKEMQFTLKKPFDSVLSLAHAQTKSRAFNPAHPRWLRTVNDVRTIIQRQDEYVYIPDLQALFLPKNAAVSSK